MIKYDRLQDQINLWLLWVLAITLGCALGWASGESLGRLVFHSFGWTLGHFVGWTTFEIILWTIRWQFLKRISPIPIWRRMDAWIWFSSELFAWSIAEGIHQLTAYIWMTSSAVWGVIVGTSIWFILACARQAKPGRWFVLAGACYGFVGIMSGTIALSLTVTLADEIQRTAERMAIPLAGWLMGGAMLGAVSGGMSGLAVARLWLKTDAY